jgi:hypothetical protein
LYWSSGHKNSYRYDVAIKQLDAGKVPELDYKKALNDKESFKSELYKIKDMEYVESNFIATVAFVEDEFEGQILWPLAGTDDSQIHQIEFLGKFDKHGNTSSFYLYQKQKNLLNLFFDVPDVPVDEDETWERDIYMIQIGQSFVPQSEKRININRLIDITQNAAGDVLAHIGGINHEEVRGNNEFAESDTLVPVSTESTHFFYGVFNVTQGYWEHNTTVAYVDTGLFNDVSVYAIKKVDH